jgi:rhodanese-related sulfurtransferase
MFSFLSGAEAQSDQIQVIPPGTVKEWVEAGEAVVVDVREPREHMSERIPGAVLIPLSSFDPGRIPEHEGKKLVIHCRSGARCGMASARLLQSGYTGTIHRLQGGMIGWMSVGGKVVRG